ncbi:MAG: protease modulator HflK [Limisphaerales bacterium]
MSADHHHPAGPGDAKPHVHGPGCGHDHDHDHDLGLPTAPAAPAAPQSPPPDPIEDAGAQALSDALRSSFLIVRVLLAALIVYFLASGTFTVGSQERAIVLRFGSPLVRGGSVELGPGLHFAFPYPVDEVVKMQVDRLQVAQSTVGWYAVTPEQEAAGEVPEAGPSLNPAAEGYAVTGDGNIIHTRATLRYRITEPLKFFLNFRNGAEIMTNVANNAILYAASQYAVDDALRRDVAGFKERVLARANALILAKELGVTLEPSDVVTIPPRQVKAEFDAVLSAEAERAKSVNDAQGYSSRVVNEARGEAAARINTGETERNRLVQSVAAEATKFASLLPEYLKNPEFFRRRLQTETLARVMTNAADKFFLPLSPDDQLRLQLNREPPKRTPAPQP